jgi:hypothetical protein
MVDGVRRLVFASLAATPADFRALGAEIVESSEAELVELRMLGFLPPPKRAASRPPPDRDGPTGDGS